MPTETIPADALRAVIAAHYGSTERASSYGFGQQLLRLLGEAPDPMEALAVRTQAALDTARVHALDNTLCSAAMDDAESMTVQVPELHALFDELARHQERADVLQAQMTENLERTIGRRVRAFHARFGHPIAHSPRVPADAQVRFRLKLIAEEFFELLTSAIADAPGESFGKFDSIKDACGDAEECVEELIRLAPIAVDLPEFADALGDIAYVVEGTNAVFGIDGVAVLGEIQRANMEKDPAYVKAKDGFHMKHPNGDRVTTLVPDPTQKPSKPAGWKPPAIEAVLIRQGWRP